MCGETRIPRDMCAGNTIPGKTHITVTTVQRANTVFCYVQLHNFQSELFPDSIIEGLNFMTGQGMMLGSVTSTCVHVLATR